MRKRKIYDDKLIGSLHNSGFEKALDYIRKNNNRCNKGLFDFNNDDYFTIMRELAISQKNYFLLNKENARDGRNQYFHFEVSLVDSKTLVRQYRYLGND